MSRQFHATDIRYLIAAATVPNHDLGPHAARWADQHVFCTDAKGDVFYYVGHDESQKPDYHMMASVMRGARRTRPQLLYRDYWRYANFNANDDADKLAPEFMSIAKGQYTKTMPPERVKITVVK